MRSVFITFQRTFSILPELSVSAVVTLIDSLIIHLACSRFFACFSRILPIKKTASLGTNSFGLYQWHTRVRLYAHTRTHTIAGNGTQFNHNPVIQPAAHVQRMHRCKTEKA